MQKQRTRRPPGGERKQPTHESKHHSFNCHLAKDSRPAGSQCNPRGDLYLALLQPRHLQVSQVQASHQKNDYGHCHQDDQGPGISFGQRTLTILGRYQRYLRVADAGAIPRVFGRAGKQ